MPTPLVAPMHGRSPEEPHRTATTLELFFDLVFVVAIAAAATGLHHSIAENHIMDGVIKYILVFFAIWWAWMNFTWFANSFDSDDVPYRLTILVQLAGALILAAGVSPAFNELNFTAMTIGYVVMRVAVVTHWVRAGRANPDQRESAFRMAGGIATLQLFWIGLLFTPESWFYPGFLLLLLGELAVPVWSQKQLTGVWHAEHIAERYGLLTIIVLGESILAASLALQAVIEAHEISTSMIPIMIGGLMTVFALWWLYFDKDGAEQLTTAKRAFVWGYGHYLVFSSGAAVGAGIAVAVDHATHHAEISGFAAGMAVAIPVAIFLASIWALTFSGEESQRSKVAGLVGIVLVLLAPFTPQPVLAIGIILMVLIAVKAVSFDRVLAES